LKVENYLRVIFSVFVFNFPFSILN